MSTKAKILAILPKITGPLSILGSSFNLCDIVTDRKKRNSTYPRLVAAMAVLDICLSFAYFCSTWPIPADSGVVWAAGNTGTCALQGFMFQFGLAIPMYNLCLTIYSAMVINLKWSNLKIKKYELGMHATVLGLAGSMALAGFPLTLYNNANLWCWVSAHPMNCYGGNSNGGDVDVECIRGKNAWIYRWAFYLWPLWLIIIAVTICMGMIALGAYRDELSTRRFRRKSVMSQQDNLSRLTGNVLWQCFFFVLAFYLTWIFPTLLRALQTAGRPVPYAIFALMASLLPMQGLFNAMVFLRPRLVRYRRKYPNERWGTTIRKAVTKTFAKLGPKKSQDGFSSPRRTNMGLSATTVGSAGGRDCTAPENSQLQASSLDIEQPASSAMWQGSLSEDQNYDDGDSSDEEDDQRIVAWRMAVARASLRENAQDTMVGSSAQQENYRNEASLSGDEGKQEQGELEAFQDMHDSVQVNGASESLKAVTHLAEREGEDNVGSSACDDSQASHIRNGSTPQDGENDSLVGEPERTSEDERRSISRDSDDSAHAKDDSAESFEKAAPRRLEQETTTQTLPHRPESPGYPSDEDVQENRIIRPLAERIKKPVVSTHVVVDSNDDMIAGDNSENEEEGLSMMSKRLARRFPSPQGPE